MSMEMHPAFTVAGIQELSFEEVDNVAGGIPLALAVFIAIHGTRAAYAAGVAAGAALTAYAVFDD